MRKVLIVLVCLLLVSVVGYRGYQRWATLRQPDDPLTDLQTIRVDEENIVATVFVVGNVAASREASLTFATAGIVQSVEVTVGDSVAADQILAELDKRDLEWAASNAELNMAIAEAELSKLKDGPPESDIASAQAALKAAQDKLTALQSGPRSSEVSAAQAALTAAQAGYDLLVAGPSDEVIRQAELQVEYAKNALWQAQSQRDAACGADNTSKSACDSFEAVVGNAHVQIEQANLALQHAQSPASDVEIKNAESQVQLAQRNLDSLLAGPSGAEIAVAQAQIAQAQAQLDKLTTGLSAEDVNIAETREKQANLAWQQAQASVSDTTLTAPFAGVLTAVNYQVGDVVRPERPGFMLADLSKLEIRVNVAEIDISRISIGQEAEIVLDALPELTIPGVVVQIAPAARSELGVVNYSITVAMDIEHIDNGEVKPGLTGNVNIIIGRRENVLVVPNRAVRQSRGRHVVTILQNDQLVEVPVQLGLSNDTETEIVSGLTKGDVVVLNTTSVQTGLSGGLFSSQQ